MSAEEIKSGFTDKEIAQAAHNLNSSIRRGGRDQSPFWHELPADAWQKEDTFRQIDLLRKNPGLTPEDEHEQWRAARLATGWKYGVERDEERKESPLLVPWNDLPFVYRARSMAGFRVIRILLGSD